MSIAWQWREATGTDVSMLLIESRADNLPPHWQVTIQGDAGAVVALSGKPLGALAMADLGTVTLYDGTATLRLSPLVSELSATCDTAISVIVVGDLPRTLRPESNPTTADRTATERRALHPRFRGLATTPLMRRVNVEPGGTTAVKFLTVAPHIVSLNAALVDNRDVDLETAETIDAPGLAVRMSIRVREGMAPVFLGSALLQEFPIMMPGGYKELILSTDFQPLESAVVVTITGDSDAQPL